MSQEELDKLAERYQDDNTIIRYYGPGTRSELEYNKTMAEVFKDGWNACKEQMIKEAVEGYVWTDYSFSNPSCLQINLGPIKGNEEVHEGDKVHVIIVKKENE